jgi:hypothetical protein
MDDFHHPDERGLGDVFRLGGEPGWANASHGPHELRAQERAFVVRERIPWRTRPDAHGRRLELGHAALNPRQLAYRFFISVTSLLRDALASPNSIDVFAS